MNTTWLLLTLAVGSGGPLAEEYSQDFRGGRPLQPSFRLIGPDALRVTRSETQGLRITLPANRKTVTPVGVAPQFWISGDFEVTASYEILSLGGPVEGPGAGFRLWMKTDSTPPQTIALSHILRRDRNQVYLTRVAAEDGMEPNTLHKETYPAKAARGQLRLNRTGGALAFSVADGPDGAFRELCKVEVGTANVSTLQMVAHTSGAPDGVDVRLIGFTVRASKSPSGAEVKAESAGGSTLLWIGGGAGVVLVSSLVVWRKRRKRAGPETLPASATSAKGAIHRSRG